VSSIVTVENLNMVISGNALLQEPITREALDLTGLSKPNVLVIGTPRPNAEDFAGFIGKATNHFGGMGLDITNLHEYDQAPTPAETEDKISGADMIWVTGGDTLKMIDFWKKHGIAAELAKAATKGTVLSGGSAGMLAWFQRGHSDSLSYRVKDDEPWDYLFAPGLGYLAATGCPHYDSKTGQAALRRVDFAEKFMADDSLPPLAIGITNRAGLALHDRNFKVVGKSDDVRQAEVHILRKEAGKVTSEQLPIQHSYAPFEL
jgi:dipeptidase E